MNCKWKRNSRSSRHYDLRRCLPESSVHLELLQDPVNLALFGIFPNQFGNWITWPDMYSPGKTLEYIAWTGSKLHELFDLLNNTNSLRFNPIRALYDYFWADSSEPLTLWTSHRLKFVVVYSSVMKIHRMLNLTLKILTKCFTWWVFRPNRPHINCWQLCSPE